MEKTFGERLTKLRFTLNKTIEEMSTDLNMVKSNISRYERDLIKPSVSFLETLLNTYRVNLNWLVSNLGDMFLNEKDLDKIDVREILNPRLFVKTAEEKSVTAFPQIFYTTFGVPVFTADPIENMVDLMPVAGEISAGEPMPIQNDEPLDFVPFPFYRANANLDDYLIFRVNGLSMKPEIEHQDIVFIKKSNNWLEMNNRIVAVVLSGELTLKKLRMDDQTQSVSLIPLNPQYRTLSVQFDELENLSLLGELKAIRRTYNK